MKNLTLTFALFLIGLTNVQAQQFQGMAVYETKTSTSDIKTRFQGNKDITPEMQKMIEDRMKSVLEKTLVLTFDKTTSIYKEQEKLDAPGAQQDGFRRMAAMMGTGGTLYKDVKEKTYSSDKEFMGKEFLVKDSLPKLNWKMEGETRMIGGYNCFKATAVRPANKSDLRNMRMKSDKKEASKDTKSETDKKTNFMDEFEMPSDVTITAWYTPEIPVNQGPEDYWGLPGLILEVNDGKTTTLCSKIVLNPKEKSAIKAPTKGKVVSQKEYDEIVVKKMEELRQMNQTRGNNGMMQMRMP